MGKDFMESFEDFDIKLVIRADLMSTQRFVSRRGQFRCLTFGAELSQKSHQKP